MNSLTQGLARASAHHPWRTIGAWSAAVVLAVVAIGGLLPGSLTTEGEGTDNPQSRRALAAREQAFPAAPGETASDVIVVRSSRYTVDAPEFRALVEELSGREIAAVSRDRHAALLPVEVAEDDAEMVIAAVEAADARPAFEVTITGEQAFSHDFNLLSQDDLKSGELQFGLPAALIVLLLVFGSVVAGLVPVLTALIAILVALALVALLAQAFELSVFVVNILSGMGLALGIDYALFGISRYREERGRGREKLDAIAATGATANRAILFSGTAFVVAMFGMFIVPSTIMRSLAVGAILVGIVSVVAALTLLPAVLALSGDRVDALRIPLVGRRSLERANPEGRFWSAVVRRVLRRPAVSFALSAAVLVAAAVPILGMHVGTSGVSTLPDRFVSKQGFLALEREFPDATPSPAEIVVVGTGADAEVERLRARLAADARFGEGQIRRSDDRRVTLLSVPVQGDPSSDPAVEAVRELRDELVPATFAGADVEVLVGGTTSENIDYFSSVIDPAPAVLAFVLGLTLVLLTLVFRSLVIAATAVVLNLLSVGAAYGLLVLVFQHGFGAGLLGFQQADTIEAWVPLFLFSVLFGLSMDYQVFLLSRIKERYDETRDTVGAVSFGVGSTARIITGAALIIVAVFSGFAAGDLIMFQQMGFGVAVALLIDATIIRSVLLPSAMRLLGERNWYLPRWLEWLPRLQVESHRAARQES